MSLTCNYQEVSRFSPRKRLRANDRYNAALACAIKRCFCVLVSRARLKHNELVSNLQKVSNYYFFVIKLGKTASDVTPLKDITVRY